MMKILALTSLTLVTPAMSLAHEEIGSSRQSEIRAPDASLPKADIVSTKKKRLTNADVWRTQRYEVWMAGNRIGYYRLVRKSDGYLHHEGHPYGHMDRKKLGKVKYYSVSGFRVFIKAQAKKERIYLRKSKVITPPVGRLTAKAASTTTPAINNPAYTIGLGLGYNNSTGYLGAGSTCFNQVTSLNSPIISSSFSVATGATSFSSQTNVSASVSGSYSFFSASGSATYANNYSTTANSGSVYLSAVGLYTATSVWHGLNAYGSQANLAGSFGANCGSQFVSSAQVGGMVMAQFGWGSNSSAASSSIQTAVTASASSGLGSMSAAVTAGNNSSSASDNTYYNFSSSSVGGGTILTNALSEALTNNAANQTSCTNGSPTACNEFATGFNADVVAGIGGTSGFMASYQNSPQDLSALTLFPEPIIGVSNQTSLKTESIAALEASSGSYGDLFANYAQALTSYTNIYNQIQTLSNRANYLYGQLQIYPSTTLNVANYIQPLINQYASDASIMLSNLGNCLTNATSSNVSTICAPISNLYSSGVTSAYDWYGSSGPNPNGYAGYALSNLQNNTIALQYIGNFSDTAGSVFKMDVAWINQLPGSDGWSVTNPTTLVSNIYSLPSLVGFVDSQWILNGSATTTPYIDMLPLNTGTGITAALSNWLSQEWTIIYGNTWSYIAAPVTLSYLNGCTSTSFSSPCTLTVNYNGSSYTSTASFSPIYAFFGADTQ
jgi:hypothetical protein